MSDMEQLIQTAGASEIEALLQAVLRRYAALFPQWEISTIRVDRTMDRAAQIDQIIAFLEKMKEDA